MKFTHLRKVCGRKLENSILQRLFDKAEAIKRNCLSSQNFTINITNICLFTIAIHSTEAAIMYSDRK